MVYCNRDGVLIRDMRWDDAQAIADAEAAQGWALNLEKYQRRLRDQSSGDAISLTAEYHGEIAGYINLYLHPGDGPFAGQGYPEIVDFGVLEKYRRKGIGSRLMDAAEQLAARYADTVYLGVGLHSGYGSAQRMYVKRGYIPDGTGVWYNGRPCDPYAECCNNDDLILYLSKRLR